MNWWIVALETLAAFVTALLSESSKKKKKG